MKILAYQLDEDAVRFIWEDSVSGAIYVASGADYKGLAYFVSRYAKKRIPNTIDIWEYAKELNNKQNKNHDKV